MSENNTEVTRLFPHAMSECGKNLNDMPGLAAGMCQPSSGQGMTGGVMTRGSGMLFACGAYRTADQLHRE